MITQSHYPHVTNSDFWTRIADTAWWQLLTIILVALLTQFFGHVFLKNRKRRQKLVETASTVISSTRQIRSSLSSYKQDELNFANTQNFLQEALKSKDQRIFMHHQQIVMTAHESMIRSQQSLETARVRFVRAAYLLRNMSYKRLGMHNKFMSAINKFLDPEIGQHNDAEAIKNDIESILKKPMQEIESVCGKEIYINTRSITEWLKDKVARNGS